MIGFFLQRIIKDRRRPEASASLALSQTFSLAPRETYKANLLIHSIDIHNSKVVEN